jgi:hypothetical protein
MDAVGPVAHLTGQVIPLVNFASFQRKLEVLPRTSVFDILRRKEHQQPNRINWFKSMEEIRRVVALGEDQSTSQSCRFYFQPVLNIVGNIVPHEDASSAFPRERRANPLAGNVDIPLRIRGDELTSISLPTITIIHL